MSDALVSFLWVLFSLPVLIISQRWIHKHLQGIALLLTGSARWAMLLYALILFPGVFLHELSHWLAATALFVRTGSVSLIPRLQADGHVQLGSVEYYKTKNVGAVRESLIGAAPLIFGTGVILLIGFEVFSVDNLIASVRLGQISPIATAISDLWLTADFYVWLYLYFAISNAMMPSPSDRRAWPAFLIICAFGLLIIYVIGLQSVLWLRLAQPVATVLNYVGLAFTVTNLLNLGFILLIFVVEEGMSRVRRQRVVYD